jgi:hypothetical protein
LLRRCLGGNRSPATHFGQLIYATHKLDVFLPPQGFSEFSDLVGGEWEHKGLAGVARVWRSALAEVFSVAVPLQLQSSIVVAAPLSLLSSFALFMAIFHVMSHVCNGK